MDYSSKKELWSYLVNFKCNISKPWCLVGDFNETISSSDRKYYLFYESISIMLHGYSFY